MAPRAITKTPMIMSNRQIIFFITFTFFYIYTLTFNGSRRRLGDNRSSSRRYWFFPMSDEVAPSLMGKNQGCRLSHIRFLDRLAGV